MKKLILLVSIVILATGMTSCLDEGSRNYSENGYVYIAMDDSGLIYGRTSTGRFITSNGIKMMMPGEFKFLSYSFEEANGTVALENFSVDNVTVSSNEISIPKTTINLTAAPEANTATFVALGHPIYGSDPVYFGDYWIFEYAYKHAEGEKPLVRFYKRENTEPNSREVKIDVRISGISSTGTTKAEAIALNMAPIRARYEGTSATSTKDVNVKFYYYQEGKTEPTETQTYVFRVKGD